MTYDKCLFVTDMVALVSQTEISSLHHLHHHTHSFIMFLTCVQLEYRNQLVSLFISHGLIIACTCSMYSVTALYWYDLTTVHSNVTLSRFLLFSCFFCLFFNFSSFFFFSSLFLYFFSFFFCLSFSLFSFLFSSFFSFLLFLLLHVLRIWFSLLCLLWFICFYG